MGYRHFLGVFFSRYILKCDTHCKLFDRYNSSLYFEFDMPSIDDKKHWTGEIEQIKLKVKRFKMYL